MNVKYCAINLFFPFKHFEIVGTSLRITSYDALRFDQALSDLVPDAILLDSDLANRAAVSLCLAQSPATWVGQPSTLFLLY